MKNRRPRCSTCPSSRSRPGAAGAVARSSSRSDGGSSGMRWPISRRLCSIGSAAPPAIGVGPPSIAIDRGSLSGPSPRRTAFSIGRRPPRALHRRLHAPRLARLHHADMSSRAGGSESDSSAQINTLTSQRRRGLADPPSAGNDRRTWCPRLGLGWRIVNSFPHNKLRATLIRMRCGVSVLTALTLPG